VRLQTEHDVLLGSRALRWMGLGRFLESLCLAYLYLADKSSHVRADVDRLTCFLHHPTFYSR
jgi:hypothetical protein